MGGTVSGRGAIEEMGGEVVEMVDRAVRLHVHSVNVGPIVKERAALMWIDCDVSIHVHGANVGPFVEERDRRRWGCCRKGAVAVEGGK